MDISGLIFAAAGDYPQPTHLTPSTQDARILQNLYAGKASETTAVMQYSYQHLIADAYSKDIATVLEEIAIVEMRHVELLGKAIVQLGGTPVYGAQSGWWRGDFVYYNKNLMEMLDRDILDEEKAIMDYKKAILMLKNEELSDLLSRIIEDEKQHIVVLTALKENLIFWQK